MDDPTHHYSPRTRQAYETTRKLGVGIIGSEVQMEALSRAHCRDNLGVLPLHASQCFQTLPEAEPKGCLRIGAGGEFIELISAANASAHLANFSSFLERAVNEEVIARNPTRGLRIPDVVAKKELDDAFHA